VCALISSSEVLYLIQVERKKDNKDVEGTKEKPNYATDVIADIRHTIHQHSLQRNESIKFIKPSIIMQTLNSTNQGIAKGTILHVVNKVRGYPPNRSDVAPSKDLHK
jgi:hypothetical protein